uniref:BZIP domain-containing protein n=1 Tax=Angiostrongylus cantonensis TaxID=6313 RepID=A0A158PCE3_ANGCA
MMRLCDVQNRAPPAALISGRATCRPLAHLQSPPQTVSSSTVWGPPLSGYFYVIYAMRLRVQLVPTNPWAFSFKLLPTSSSRRFARKQSFAWNHPIINNLDHPRPALVVNQGPVILPQDRPRIVSPTSVLGGSIFTPLSKHTSDGHQLSSPHPHHYDREPQTTSRVPSFSHSQSDSVVKPPLLPEHVTNGTDSKLGIPDLTLDYSHLICPHNIDDFGADIAYGKDGSVASYSSKQSSQLEGEPDFSFIDDIYESVKAEIGAERACSSFQTASVNSADITTDKSAAPVITLAIDQPVTIVGGDGKEYKCTTKPKRAPGVTLANMSIEEINKRKREQNRIAAQRYRQKQKCSKDADKEEHDRLEKRNLYLQIEAARLQDEIECLRKKILGSMAKR